MYMYTCEICGNVPVRDGGDLCSGCRLDRDRALELHRCVCCGWMPNDDGICGCDLFDDRFDKINEDYYPIEGGAGEEYEDHNILYDDKD